jgi:hypothetical protein
LELAHLKYYTADLHVLSTTEPQTEWNTYSNKKQWWEMDPF